MTSLPSLAINSVDFPAPDTAFVDPNGLLAMGGDLSPARLIAAYRLGIFPWFEPPQPILWWSPSPRAVLFPSEIYISKSLKKTIRRGEYSITCDQAFEQVIHHCAVIERPDQDGTWISQSMESAYLQLRKLGVAHSLEVWHEQQLVGGLYGLAIGGIFFGESMFSLRSNASKLALVYLAAQLKAWDFALIDCQVSNPHLLSLGAREIDRPSFNQLLEDNIDNAGPKMWPSDWQAISRLIL